MKKNDSEKIKEENKKPDDLFNQDDHGLSDEDDFLDEKEFNPCSRCDGHPACEDFGCAYELGLGRMVKKDIPYGSDEW